MSNDIATVRIELVDTDPLIWRQVEVPTAMTLKALHDVIQVVMGWTNSHLWEFTIGKQRYGLPQANDGWGDTPAIDASKTLLRDVLIPRSTVIDYLYDFGDSWEHRLTVTNVRPATLRSDTRDTSLANWRPRQTTAAASLASIMRSRCSLTRTMKSMPTSRSGSATTIRVWSTSWPIKYALGHMAKRRRAGRAKAKK